MAPAWPWVPTTPKANFSMGFSAADFAECGPVLFGHGADAASVRESVQRLHTEVVSRRAEWSLDLLSPAGAIAQLEPCACAELEGIRVLLSSAKAQGPMTADPGDLPWTKLPTGMASKP